MKVSLDKGTATYRIRGYGPGLVTVNETDYTENLVILPDALIDQWNGRVVADLTEGHFEAVMEHTPEIILLGTGREQLFPPPSLMAALGRRGIGLETMDTAAACRTYNVLMSEDRHVAAALMMIEDE